MEVVTIVLCVWTILVCRDMFSFFLLKKEKKKFL